MSEFITTVRKKFEDALSSRGYSKSILYEDLEKVEKLRDTPSHAFIFEGEERAGVELARYFFVLKNCPAYACEGCQLCEAAFLKSAHPDFILVSPEGSEILRKQVVDEVIRFASEKSIEVPVKFLAIEEAHLLNAEAANLLLKIVEEPPPSTNFVFITSKPDALLETIQSRCARVRFSSKIAEVENEILQVILKDFVVALAETSGLHNLDLRLKEIIEGYAKKQAVELEERINYLESLELDKKQKKRILSIEKQRYERMRRRYERELVLKLLASILRLLNLLGEKRLGGTSFLLAESEEIALMEILDRELTDKQVQEIQEIIEEGIGFIYSEVKPEYVLKGVILKSWKVVAA